LIVGESEVGSILEGGIHIQSDTDLQSEVVLKNLSIVGSEVSGVWNQGKIRLRMDSCSIKNCTGHGIEVMNRAQVHLNNVSVQGCKCSGVVAKSGSTIEICGDRSKSITGNCTKNRTDDFGLNVKSSASKIVVMGLTKERCAVENEGGGNYGGSGKISFRKE